MEVGELELLQILGIAMNITFALSNPCNEFLDPVYMTTVPIRS